MVAGVLDKYELGADEIEELQRKAIEPVEIEATDKSAVMITDDPKCNYICGSKGTQEDLTKLRENWKLISSEGVDYNLVTEAQRDHKENVMDKRDSLSYMSVNTVDEGIEWYRQNFPKVPEELLPMMARWNFGDLSLVTGKDVKNDKKRIERGKKPKMCGKLEVKKGNFVVEF